MISNKLNFSIFPGAGRNTLSQKIEVGSQPVTSSLYTTIGPKKAPAFAAAMAGFSLFLVGCQNPTPRKSSPKKTPETAPINTQELPCPSNSKNLPHLALPNLSAEAVSYLKKYPSIPTAHQGEFCRFLENLQIGHEKMVEEGLIDMMGEYFVTSQTIQTGYYNLYTMENPGEEIPLEFQPLMEGHKSELGQVDDFLKAVDSDPDPIRKALFEDQFKKLDPNNRRAGAKKLVALIKKNSWATNENTPTLLDAKGKDDSYYFVDRGLRTTSFAFMGSTLNTFFTVDTSALVESMKDASTEDTMKVVTFANQIDTMRKAIPEKIKRVLIIGPGLEFSHLDVGEQIPRQSYEPFGILETLVASKRADLNDIQINLFDINDQVDQHWKNLKQSAEKGSPYTMTLVVGRQEMQSESIIGYVGFFGASFPGAVLSEVKEGKSRMPITGTLDLASVATRTVTLPAEIVKKFTSFRGDMTTTDLQKLDSKNDGKYDVIFCFNTMVYLDEQERVLAGINIQKALADGGAFITDNHFETDTGERMRKPGAGTAKPLFESSFLAPVGEWQFNGRKTIIYQKEK